MCKFFSFISDGNGNFYYFNDEQRKKILKKELIKEDGYIVESADSHSSIARYYFKNAAEDKMNKYEFNPLTHLFEVDQINTTSDIILAENFVRSLDFRSIVLKINYKKIENPLEIEFTEINDYHKALLKSWASVRASVVASVVASAWASVRASVVASVWAYQSSFFDLEKSEWKHCEKVDFQGNNNPFQSCIDLYWMGLIPSFNGKTWRLHAGKKAEIVFEITKEELEKFDGENYVCRVK
jgi:hypothetical protein